MDGTEGGPTWYDYVYATFSLATEVEKSTCDFMKKIVAIILAGILMFMILFGLGGIGYGIYCK